MGDLMNNATFSMAEAKFVMGDFNQVVLNSANTKMAQLKAATKKDNVAGFVYIDLLMLLTSCVLLLCNFALLPVANFVDL